jgi:hypothetical protein
MAARSFSTVAEREAEARVLALSFARVWDTSAVREGVALAEAGRVEWSALAALFARSYATAVREVAS